MREEVSGSRTKRSDVARLAGVSPAVVSYVINNGPRPVSARARIRVEAAIEALDYRPNPIASALRGGTTKAIGLLIPSPVNSYFAEIADVIESELLLSGNALSICITDDDAGRERLHIRSLLDRRVDGMIIVSSRSLGPLLTAPLPAPPVVVLDRVEKTSLLSSVHVDNVRDAASAVQHLQWWGHRVIGCISGPWPVRVSSDRIEGWRSQQERVGAPRGSELVAHAELTAEAGWQAARSLLSGRLLGRRSASLTPTALFVVSDAQAHGVLRACRELGLRVPEDMSIVSFDGTRSARFSDPPLTTMRQPIRAIGKEVVTILLDQVADPALSPVTRTFASNLVIGGTCAPPRTSF